MRASLWPWGLLAVSFLPALFMESSAPHAVSRNNQTTLSEAIYHSPKNLDPALASTSTDWAIDNNIFQTLLVYRGGTEKPLLASTIQSQGRTVTMKLGHHYLSNGSPLNADVVAAALARPLWHRTHSIVDAQLLSNVVGVHHVVAGRSRFLSGVQVQGPWTLSIRLKHASDVSGFLRNLTNPALAIVPASDQIRGGMAWQFTDLYGTGGYKLVNWSPKDQLTFQRTSQQSSGPQRVILMQYPSFKQALISFESHLVNVVPVRATWLSRVPRAEFSQLQFVRAPGFVAWYAMHLPKTPSTQEMKPIVQSAFLGYPSPIALKSAVDIGSGTTTVGVNSHNAMAVQISHAIQQHLRGRIVIRQSSSHAQLVQWAKSGKIQAFLGLTPLTSSTKAKVPLAPQGTFWLAQANVGNLTTFSDGQLAWSRIMLH